MSTPVRGTQATKHSVQSSVSYLAKACLFVGLLNIVWFGSAGLIDSPVHRHLGNALLGVLTFGVICLLVLAATLREE